jgi:hypothetical protein
MYPGESLLDRTLDLCHKEPLSPLADAECIMLPFLQSALVQHHGRVWSSYREYIMIA